MKSINNFFALHLLLFSLETSFKKLLIFPLISTDRKENFKDANFPQSRKLTANDNLLGNLSSFREFFDAFSHVFM